MKHDVFIPSDVYEEIQGIMDHIAKDSFPAALRFCMACEETFEKISQSPELGSPFDFDPPRLRNTRVWQIKGFENYLMIYRFTPDRGIRVLHVLHGARDLESIL
ncbi:MAG: type II toxin-antitoxin system RelE/ParE family toxin [Gemmataceae bacterium]|nr:type II toxin-antitoxin system RelE/ParE family toxin [Gemmataceae bacterium]MCI0742594.1 type II toxin-antitoxin system RelE/ParE family toxin [Gemmataceae bacterium]